MFYATTTQNRPLGDSGAEEGPDRRPLATPDHAETICTPASSESQGHHDHLPTTNLKPLHPHRARIATCETRSAQAGRQGLLVAPRTALTGEAESEEGTEPGAYRGSHSRRMSWRP